MGHLTKVETIKIQTPNSFFSQEFRDRILTVDVFVEYATEPNYGADADGRRGMPIEILEDWFIGAVYDESGSEIILSSREIGALGTLWLDQR